MDESLRVQIETYLSHLDGLIRRGRPLRDTLEKDPASKSAIAATRVWQEDCGVTVNQLSGGSKAHWLARSFSEAFLMRSAAGSAVEGAAPAEIVMRVIVAPPVLPFGSLGFSVVDVERRTGTLATVFVDRVRALSALAGADSGLLLGRAMAHEIGHLLLGTTHHADRGLMRGLWTTIDLQKEQPWDWVLSREDGVRMRRALDARLRVPEQPAAIVARK